MEQIKKIKYWEQYILSLTLNSLVIKMLKYFAHFELAFLTGNINAAQKNV